MRIAIHAGTLRGLGSSAVGQHVLRELAVRGYGHSVDAWIPTDWPEAATSNLGTVRLHRVAPGALAKFAVENLAIRRAIHRGSVERLLSLGDTSLPSPGVPHLLLVQQAFLAYEPSEWGFTPRPASRLKMAMMAGYFRAGLPGVTRLTVQTLDMKTHLTARWGIDPGKVTVVPSTVGAPWEAAAQRPVRRAPAGPPTICCPAGPAPHKNHAVLVPMLRAVASKHPDVRLVVTMDRGARPDFVEAARRGGVLQLIDFCGALGSEALVRRIEGATAVVAPSVLESFGLTYYEAMAAGTPVVASDRGFAREAMGQAGRYAAPHDGDAWADAVLALIESGSGWSHAAAAVRERYLDTRRGWAEISADYLALLEGLE